MPTNPDDPQAGVLYATPSIQKLATGIRELQNPPYLELGSSTPQSLQTATWTQLTAFASVSGAGAGLGSAGASVTVTTAGRYRATGIVVYSPGTAGGARVANVSATPGSQSAVASFNGGWAGTATSTSVQVSYILTVPANGAITLWGYQGSGAALNVILTRLYVEQLSS